MKKLLISGAICVALLGACSGSRSGVEYNSVATICQTYAAALRTATKLKADGKLSAASIAKIDATTAPAQAVCSGNTPNSDAAAVQKVADAVIAVLEAK